MTKLATSAVSVVGAIALSASAVAANAESEYQEIKSLLASYEQALNSSNTEQAVALYTLDGVFMPQHSPSQVGEKAIKIAYDNVFSAITLSVTFDIREIHLMSPEWAFARTNSKGTVKINATGETVLEANQELFLLQKAAGDWKIARYAFSTVNPPRS